MSKQTLRKVPAEAMMWADFDMEYGEIISINGIVITGNRRMCEYGDKTLRDVINGDYYDYDCEYDYDKFDMLKKLTGKAYDSRCMRGYCQGDWQDIYYPEGTLEELLEEIENIYMGKYEEYVLEDDDGDCSFYVPDDVCWKGKKAICEYCGCDPEDTIVLIDDGYRKVYKYKELED